MSTRLETRQTATSSVSEYKTETQTKKPLPRKDGLFSYVKRKKNKTPRSNVESEHCEKALSSGYLEKKQTKLSEKHIEKKKISSSVHNQHIKESHSPDKYTVRRYALYRGMLRR